MFGTPDFGHSDIWHFNFALKFLLSKTLKDGYLPIWSKDIGTGFPLLGEGQIGMFNLYNLLVYKLFDPVIAFNLGYLFIFLTLIIGAYLYGRVIKLSKLSSVFLATVFSFSGVIVTQVNHYNLLQALSFFPLELFLIEKFIRTDKKRWLLVFSFVLQQQIFSGFQQATLICLFGVGIYTTLRLWKDKTIAKFFIVTFFILLGIIISFPQLIPTFQLAQASKRDGGISIEEMARFPYNPKNLLSFINPYFFGDPRIGTYPTYNNDWGIFWESTGYVGIFPLILLLGGLFFRKQLTIFSRVYVPILVVTLILFLGKYTPFFFLFQIFPFSIFRVPARFLFLFVWAMLVIAAIFLDRVRNNTIRFLIVVLSLANISYFSFQYNPILKRVDKWLDPPETVNILKEDPTWFRTFSYVPFEKWNNIFLTKGWANIEDYSNFRNSLDPNQNLYWGISSANFYAGMSPKRLSLWQQLISSGITTKDNQILISSSSAKLISLAGVKYFITPNQLDNSFFQPHATTSSDPIFHIYKNTKGRPHSYLTTNYVVAKSVNDLLEKVFDSSLDLVVVEENLPFPSNPNSQIIPNEVILNTDLNVHINTFSTESSLLVLSDSYYHGWKAYTDNVENKVIPVNLNQRGVVLPPGKHFVEFKLQLF